HGGPGVEDRTSVVCAPLVREPPCAPLPRLHFRCQSPERPIRLFSLEEPVSVERDGVVEFSLGELRHALSRHAARPSASFFNTIRRTFSNSRLSEAGSQRP